MPLKPAWERFSQELANGVSTTTAYARAGYKPNSGNAAMLKRKQCISARVAEILAEREQTHAQATAEAIQRVALTKEWLLERLMRNACIAIGEEKIKATVLDKTTGGIIEIEVTDRDGAVANKSMELLGKELGLFVGNSAEQKGTNQPHAPVSENVFDLEEMRAKYNVSVREN